ncbi:MAG TPA: serine hydrolase domain-containing protein [Chitinispirillaceae bacterium]|nr:serine hydrolase domain-containing protein [Chitinispirillaceae bacterium]
MIDLVRRYLQSAIEERVFPGCSAGIYYKNQSHLLCLGHHTYDKNSPEVTSDTIYDVASVTKVIPVSALALKLINDNQMQISDQLIKYVPEFKGSHREEIQIKHLLTHTLSFDFRLSDYKDLSSDSIIEKILSARLQDRPGERFFYANATSILLGMAVERCTGKTLDKAASDSFFTPLGMNNTTFDPSKYDLQQVAPSEIDYWRGRLIQSEVHDESAWALRPKIVGSAGLFSTAADLLKFGQLLLENGVYEGKEFFRPETINSMHTNQRPGAAEWTGLGWELNQRSFMGKFSSASAFGKTGFTGCSVVIDPQKKVAFVLLSNHVYPRRRSNRDCINAVRSGFADCIIQNL